MKGNVFYIRTLERDLLNHRLVFHFLGDVRRHPDKIVRVLTFTHIRDFHEQWLEEEDKDLIASLIGITEQPEGVGTRYFVTVEQFEFSFYTETEPQLEERT
jgi:hypothetical protein